MRTSLNKKTTDFRTKNKENFRDVRLHIFSVKASKRRLLSRVMRAAFLRVPTEVHNEGFRQIRNGVAAEDAF